MPCYNPIKGWLARSPSENGGRAIVFKRELGFSDMPRQVPCGQCIGCRLERSRQWAIRCVHESLLWQRNCFITLTYDDKHCPANRGLCYYDYQLFMKRLRKSFSGFQRGPDGKRPIRFFHCGEYGEKNLRPHYHAILFNFDFTDKVLFKTERGFNVFRSATLERLWPYGFSTVAAVSFESAAYVARYCLKKVTGEHAPYYYEDRVPEYATMSRKPGIASAWYDKFKHHVYSSGDDCIFLRGGRKMRPPRFYDLRYEAEAPELMAYIKRARRAMAVIHEDESTPERLLVRESVKKAQVKMLLRKL